MSSKVGVQSQSGVIQDASKLLAKHPVAWLLLGNALSLDFAKRIRAESPSTLILLRTQADNWSLDAGIVDFANRSMVLASPFQNAGVCDFLLPPNEPVVQNDVNARRLNEQMVQCAEMYKSYGYKTGAYNFSVGNPDYPLWAYLNDGVVASDGWLFLHEYGSPSLQNDASNLSLRHRKARSFLSPQVQAILKVGITECFIDLGATGGAGGYRKLPNPTDDDLWWIRNLTTQLDWWDAELSKDPYVRFACGYGYAMEFPWSGEGSYQFDVAEVDTDRAFFINWIRSGVAPTPPPNPEPEPSVPITPAETIATVPFLVKRAIQLDLGPSIYGEYEARSADGTVYRGWIWQRGGVIVKDGDYGSLLNAKLFNPQTGEPMAQPLPWPGGNPTPPPSIPPFVVPPALPASGANAVEGVIVPNAPFYRLTGANTRSGVSAFCKVTVLQKNGAPAIGARVVNLRPDGNKEVQLTDGGGNVQFFYGASSAFTVPGTGPFTNGVVDSADKFIGDKATSLGDFQGEHTEWYLQFMQVQ